MSQNLATSAPTKRAYSKKIHSNHKISGFATAWLHALPDIETILKQVRRAVGYTAKKNAIRAQYERDIQAFAHLPAHEAQVCALVNAQKAADCANGYEPYTPTPAEITHFYALASGEIAENGAESVSGSLKNTENEPNPAPAPTPIKTKNAPMSGFVKWVGNTPPSIGEIIDQIHACKRNTVIRNDIYQNYKRNLVRYREKTHPHFAFIFALILAQMGVDRHKGATSDTPSLKAWRKMKLRQIARMVARAEFNGTLYPASPEQRHAARVISKQILADLGIPARRIAPKKVSGSLKTTAPNPPTISIERKRKSNHAAPILCRAIRHFPTQQKASVYLSHRVKACANDRFIIQQVNQHKWAVCRVLSGGVA